MLLVRCYVDAGIIPPFDPRPYPIDWHLHRSEERYLGFVAGRAVPTDAPGPGDVAVFRYGRCYSHGGIITAPDPLTIVHAFWPARCVLEEPIARNGALASADREIRFFTLWPPP